MHIAEGILTSSSSGTIVLAAGFALSGIGVGIGLRKMDDESIPRAGVLGAAFFVISLLPIPVGVGSVHLLLTGLMGILLGWGAFPTIAVALTLQAVFFGDGGLSALGVNTLSMGLPAVICGSIFGLRPVFSRHPSVAKLGPDGEKLPLDRAFALRTGFLAGILAVLLGMIIVATALVLTDSSMSIASISFIAGNLVLAPIEGLVTAATLVFVCRVQPSMLLAVE